MNSKSTRDEFTSLPKALQARLNVITQTVPKFWNNNRHHNHFTNHGPEHSERIHSQKLAQLAQGLPEARRLNPEEVFVVSAAAWLYEIGMQSPHLKPILDIEYHPGEHLSFSQCQEIRDKKHLLTRRLIKDSARRDYAGMSIPLGLSPSSDDYTHLISEVCRWCSNDALDNVPERLPVGGIPVRVRLLVALLRLADQLYIDSSRVNLDLLEQANLPIEEFVKWWAYHYVQTLPITGGKIRFHYFLPSTQKQYLGHLRGLIEPRFEYRRNSIVQYLSDEHQLHLIPHRTPTFQFDQPEGFLREMDARVIRFLRQEVDPIDTRIVDIDRQERERRGQSLLVLDYENFVIQLGQEGYYLTADELSQAVVTLLAKAGEQFSGTVDALAIGHWHRPDLVEVGHMLKKRVYRLLPLRDQEEISQRLIDELSKCLQKPKAPDQIIIVAPRPDLAPTVKEFADSEYFVTAWVSDLPDSEIYPAITRESRFLRDILRLGDAKATQPIKLENLETACILRIDNWIAAHRSEGIPLQELSSLLERIPFVDNQILWLRLWLFSQGMLAPVKAPDQQPAVRPVSKHPRVEEVRSKHQTTIQTLWTLSQDGEDIHQDLITTTLVDTRSFECEEDILNFLEILKTEDVVFRKAVLGSPEAKPMWQLNPANRSVVLLNAEYYLPRFILAFDQGLLREGHHFAHKRRLPQYVSPHFGEASTVENIYDLASEMNWIHTRRSNGERRHRNKRAVHVMINESHRPVAETLRHQDIILNILNHRSARDGIEQNALWQKLKRIRVFTLGRREFEQWMNLLRSNSVVMEQDRDDRQNTVQLNHDALLTQRLLGRLYLYGLVRNLRIMGATSPQRKRPTDVLIAKLAKYVTHHDKRLAQWVLDYAKCINLAKEQNGRVFLARHSFVYNLDRRERRNCEKLVELVKSLARPGSDGWVPRYVVRDKMQDYIEQYGYTLGELEYWIDQAIHRLRILERDWQKSNGRSEEVVRPAQSGN